jgi:SAM-dependent methyltransferase
MSYPPPPHCDGSRINARRRARILRFVGAGDPDDYRASSLEMWDRMASGWERRRTDIDEATAPVREWLVRALAPQPGDTVLELAAGPGDTGHEVAALVGDGGCVISTDFSPEMVGVARRRGEEVGLRNVDYRTMDAERLELDDESVDGVICRFGFMLMADPAAALAETRRVLRSGGRLVLAVWRGSEQNPWVAIAGRELVERGHMAPPEPGSPGIFSMASDDRVRSLLEAAGFTQVRIEDIPVLLVYRGIDDYIAFASDTGGSFSAAFREASEEERAAMTRAIEERFRPFEVDGSYRLPGLALVAVAS